MNESLVFSVEEQRLSDTITELGKEFIEPIVGDVPTITEDFFVRVFLPMFAGDEVLPYPVTNGMWLNVSHSPFNEVRVINAGGHHIFNVPPLLDQSMIKPLDGTGVAKDLPSITDMLTRARLVGKQGANAMNRYLKEELERRNFMFSESGNVDIGARWIEIFKRYNRVENTGAVAPGQTPSAARPADHDSSEFDPL